MKGIPQKNTPTGTQYYAVLYLFNNTVHMIPFDTQEEALETGNAQVAKLNEKNKAKHPIKKDPFVKNFYVIKRSMDKYKNGEII